MSKGKILFQLTGSIAAYKSCYLISRLVQSGYEVEVVASRGALEFVGAATLEGLCGRPVHTDVFAPGQMMSHIHLMKWADLILLCPATANSLTKLAAGIGDDLISTLFLAYDFQKPYLVAPAMNTKMYQHPATQSALTQLRNWGVKILETNQGNLACGDVGEGRLLEPDQIYQAIEAQLKKPNSPHLQRASESLTSNPVALSSEGLGSEGLKILITSGGTSEPIDGVRSITNFSSGRTGALLADTLDSHGHRVTLVSAKDAIKPVSKRLLKSSRSFVTFQDLRSLLHEELSSIDFDAIIHLAAVSDYSVDQVETNGSLQSANSFQPGSGKIDSSESITIRLKRNPKIISELRDISRNKNIQIIAFKLTNTSKSEERMSAIEKLAISSRPNFIVHNDLSEIDTGSEQHLSMIYLVPPNGAISRVGNTETKSALATLLEKILLESLDQKDTDKTTDNRGQMS